MARARGGRREKGEVTRHRRGGRRAARRPRRAPTATRNRGGGLVHRGAARAGERLRLGIGDTDRNGDGETSARRRGSTRTRGEDPFESRRRRLDADAASKAPAPKPARVGSHPRWRTSAKNRRSVAHHRRGWTRASENAFDWRRIGANVSSANSPRSARDIDGELEGLKRRHRLQLEAGEGANAISATVWNVSDGSYPHDPQRTTRASRNLVALAAEARGYSPRRDERASRERRAREDVPPSSTN